MRAATLKTAVLAPISCAVIGGSSSRKYKYRRVFFALRVMPSELVNSVISSPHPPNPRITRRKSVSVTPAIGASTAAGRIVRARILNDAGIIRLRALLRRRVVGLQEFIEAEEFTAHGA